MTSPSEPRLTAVQVAQTVRETYLEMSRQPDVQGPVAAALMSAAVGALGCIESLKEWERRAAILEPLSVVPTDEQINELWSLHARPEHGFDTPPWIRFARALLSFHPAVTSLVPSSVETQASGA